MNYFSAFISTFLLAAILTPFVRKFALKNKIVDYPSPRKIHSHPIPLLGGLIIFLSFFIVLAYFTFFTPYILGKSIALKQLIGIFIAGLFLISGGFLDDKYNLPPKKQFIFPLLAVLTIIASGIGVKYITNPFNGIINLELNKFFILNFQGAPYYFSWPADLLTFFWLLGMIYTTKFLDGLDGLVSGITAIGGLIIFGLCLFTIFYQPEVGLLAIILAGACLGFLIFNWHPAKIFLGEGGSTFCGFMLGVLAIISGGKFATTLLVMGIAVIDVIWVIARRVFWERHSPFLADKKHLHFRLLDIGLSPRQAVVFLYFLSLIFGLSTFFLKSSGKLITMGILSGLMAVLAIFLVGVYKIKNKA
ncbi:MAG: Uncharacterized protein Athens101410_397 [Parcubacteria group bacterium Athens1014_10]|nr:MAG: Uncharacterized protein Athens101410_397 [Parcubacteria group bacterium Athens1014_10]TSD05476.1 MAG: Uncharacterized protein Athens071412_286 [Parcubacteria group bacterium Athens0714_12]